ncbi:NAD(P)-dependent oxidoreductase [Leptolyngbya sp. FACHB-541]|uniref:SDR family oxidoreductase n=1 Tax=Leptolyngbya sp. FACHB-541 TaxID=2692810 RepID=UPI001681D8FF|nr:NAD(P)-dependent oxidoreductase [Leptolyngbya sp. FACHB-541]MBD1997642.1 NAD(P)-dependent oxidoreductase [Leptolyngbya sp. FACHB-541]
MKKLLITGASGFLGWHLCQLAQTNWQVYGTYHRRSVEIPGVTLLPVDLTDFQALQRLFQQLQPDAVIHTAAASSPNFCQTHPEISHAINVSASCNLAGLSADAEIPCVFTSSDMVFDGRNAPYRESDPVCPVNHYGEQKVAAEVGMLARYPKAAVCRMPLMFGAAPFAQSFIQPFIEKLRSGEELNLFIDEFRTPISGTAAAHGLLLALEKVHGYIHLGGKERMSRYEFGCLMVKVLELSMAKVSACRQADVKMAAPRPADLSMDSSLAFKLGFNPASVEAELQALKERL